jgi:hypothetical protein
MELIIMQRGGVYVVTENRKKSVIENENISHQAIIATEALVYDITEKYTKPRTGL